jgi:hypothetical protein
MPDNLTFIASGGRTGTQFLGHCMSRAVEDCFSVHEPDIFQGWSQETLTNIRQFGLWHMTGARALGRSGIRALGTRYLTGKSDFATTAKRLRAQRAAYHSSIAASLVVESYYAWWMVAPRLREIFPGAALIGIVRDPRHWIASWMARAPGRGSGHWTHQLPPGPLTAVTLGDERWSDSWETLSEVARLAWQWQLINATLARAEDEGVLDLFRFEDVFDPASDALPCLLESATSFAGRSYRHDDLRPALARRHNQSSAKAEDWQGWPPAERCLVNEMCGPLMERFGYPPV